MDNWIYLIKQNKILNVMKELNKESLNSKDISFIDKYFPFRKEHAETGISMIDYLKSKKSKTKK